MVLNVVLLAGTALLFLLPIHLFLHLRLRRAIRRGTGLRYVPRLDPWLPVVVAVAGAGVIAILGLIG